jgi:hypothetical protein
MRTCPVTHEGGQGCRRETQDTAERHEACGPTGLDVFYQRVQWRWGDEYPFIDTRTQAAAGELALPRKAEESEKVIENE